MRIIKCTHSCKYTIVATVMTFTIEKLGCIECRRKIHLKGQTETDCSHVHVNHCTSGYVFVLLYSEWIPRVYVHTCGRLLRWCVVARVQEHDVSLTIRDIFIYFIFRLTDYPFSVINVYVI